MHHQIDSLAYTNQLRSLPPDHKIGFAIALFILSYFAPPIIQLLIALWLMVWVVVYAKIPAKIYFKLLAIPISFWLLSLPALILGITTQVNFNTVQFDVLWGVELGPFYLYLSQQGLTWTKLVLTRAIALTSCMYFILFTVPFVEIIRTLRRLRCPTLVTELLSLMYRFIFVLTDTVLELITAQKSRNGYTHWRVAWRSLSLVVGQLLWRTLDNYRQIALGLQARGFNGELRVCHTHRYKTNWRYIYEAVGGYCSLLLFLINN